MSFPNKVTRTKCWAARDELWTCLDKNNDEAKVCKSYRAMFEKECPDQWVLHFDRKRDYLKYKEQISKGYEPISDPNRFEKKT